MIKDVTIIRSNRKTINEKACHSGERRHQTIDYVVIHELCHRKEMNHSKNFWNQVARIMPEYKTYVKWLKDKGALILQSRV